MLTTEHHLRNVRGEQASLQPPGLDLSPLCPFVSPDCQLCVVCRVRVAQVFCAGWEQCSYLAVPRTILGMTTASACPSTCTSCSDSEEHNVWNNFLGIVIFQIRQLPEDLLTEEEWENFGPDSCI